MLRFLGYSVIYALVYQLRAHLSTTQFFVVIGLTTLGVYGIHRYLKKGDEAILQKVRASQDRYEYEQAKKVAAAKNKSTPLDGE